MYVNTTLFTLLHCCMFQPSRGHTLGFLIRFVSGVILQEVCVCVCVRVRVCARTRAGDSRTCRPVIV